MRFPLNNVTTADGYTDANTLLSPRSSVVTILVRNAAIYYQLGTQEAGSGGGVTWQPEVFLPPAGGSFDRICDAVRVRSAVAGVPAQATVTTTGPEDA